MIRESDPRKIRTVAVLVTALSGLLYFCTAARDIVVGDTPELITVAATLGVAHPPGYPLFTMLGHLFALLPFGSIPFRVNLLAGVCSALTAGIVCVTAFRLTKSVAAAGIAGLALAVNPLFWSWSLVGEVFSLNNLLASLMIYWLVRWREESERAGFLFLACLTAGLGLTNHQSIIFLAPACLVILWQGRAVLRSRPQILLIGAALFLIGLLPYLYVLWAAARHPAYDWGHVSSFRDLLRMIARRSYGTGHLVSVPEYRGGSVIARILALCTSFDWLGGGLTLLGLISAYRRQRWYFWFVLVAFALTGVFFAVITNLNLATAPSAYYVLSRFFLLPQVVTAPLIAFGVIMIADLLDARVPPVRSAALWLVAGAVAVVIALTVVTGYRAIDQSGNRVARNFAEDVFNSLDSNAILLASGDHVVLPLVYLRTVERVRPDVTLVILPLLPGDWYLNQLREQNPELKVPFERYEIQTNNLKMFADANTGRTIALIGTIPTNDTSLESGYRFRQRGLVNMIEPKGGNEMTVQDLANDNEQIMNRYSMPAPDRIKKGTFETEFLSLYGMPAAHVGSILEQTGSKAEARRWYQRALTIDPGLPRLREALSRVEP